MIHDSLDAFKASKDKNFKKPVAADPLERFLVHGWFWTGQIAEDEKTPGALPLPLTVKIASDVEAKQAARKGWRPLIDREGKCGVPEEVRAMFEAFYAGKTETDGKSKNQAPPPSMVEFLKATAPGAAKK